MSGPAQRERPDAGGQRPDEALQVAERVLHGLAAPQPQAGVSASAMAAMQNAEHAVQDARSAADEVTRRLGLGGSRQDAIQQLEQLRERLVRLGAMSVGDTEIDRNHQTFLQPLIQSLDTAIQRAREQRGERLSAEDTASAASTSRTVHSDTQVLSTVITTQRQVTEAGAPPELRAILDHSLDLHRRGETGRTTFLIGDVAGQFVSRADFLRTERGQADRDRLLGLARRTGDLQVTSQHFDLAEARTQLGQISAAIETHRMEYLEEGRRALEAQTVMMSQMLIRASSEAIREQMRRIIDDANTLVQRLGNRDQAASVSDEEMARISRRMLGAQEMSNDLESAPLAMRGPLGTTYAAGLDVLASGGSTGNFDAVMFAAAEIKRSATMPAVAGRAYRSEIVTSVGQMRSATDQASRDQAQQALISVVATRVSGELTTEAARITRVSADAAAPFTQMATALHEHPEQATLEILQRARMALELGRRMTDSISSAHQLSAEARNGVLTIYGRALTDLATGGSLDAVVAQTSLAEMYARRGMSDQRRQDIERLSSNLAQHPEQLAQVQQYVQIDSTIQQLTTQRDSLPAGSTQRTAMDAVLQELNQALNNLGSGGGILPQDVLQQRITEILPSLRARAGDPQIAPVLQRLSEQIHAQHPEMNDEQVQAQALNMAAAQIVNASEEQRIQELAGTAATMVQVLGRTRSGAQRADLAELFKNAIDAIIGRNSEDATIYRQAAQTYSRLTTDRDRSDMMTICRQAAGVEPQAGQSRFDPTQRLLLQVYQQRGQYESQITDQALLRNARAYFDLALQAARTGDQYQTILDLAVLYAGMAAVPPGQLTTDALRQQRTDAMAHVQSTLGNFGSLSAITQGRRVLDIGAEGTRGWALPATFMDNLPVTRALTTRPPGSLYEALSPGNPQQGATILQQISDQTGRHMLNLETMNFERRAADIVGRTDRDSQRAQSQYAREADRLTTLARQAHDRGDLALESYYRRQAEMCDRRFVTESVDAARQMHTSGRQDIERAMQIRDESRGASALSEADLRTRIAALTADLPADQRGIITEMLGTADLNREQMLSIAQRIIPTLPQDQRQGFIDRIRQAGSNMEQLRGIFLELMLTQLALEMPQGGGREALLQRVTAARSSTADMRRLYTELIYAQTASMVSQLRMERGRDLQQRSGQVLDGLSAFDRSVRTIDTPRRESGRLELFAGIRAQIGLGLGRDVDMLGRFVGADGRPVQSAAQAAPLPEGRRQVLQVQARVGIARGQRLIEEQVAFIARRSQVVGNAQTQVRDENVSQARTMISRMIGMLPADGAEVNGVRVTAAGAASALALATTRQQNETETAFRERQVRELQALITQLSAATNISATRTVEGNEVPVFDVSRGYNDYRRIVGLAYSGHFDEAGRQTGIARGSILSSSTRLGNRINTRELQISWDAVTTAPDPPVLIAALRRLEQSSARAQREGRPVGSEGGAEVPRGLELDRPLLETLVGRLPSDRAEQFRTRYGQIASGTEGAEARRSLLTELVNETVPDPMRAGLPESQRSRVPLMTVAGVSRMGYYNQAPFETRLDEVDRMLGEGNATGAMTALGSVSSDITSSYYTQSRDTNGFRDLTTAARRSWERWTVATEFQEPIPSGEGAHARDVGQTQDRNGALTSRAVYNPHTMQWESLVGEFQGSYQRSVDGLISSARASFGARDEISRNAGAGATSPGLTVDRRLTGDLIASLPNEVGRAYAERLNADPSQAGQIYTDIVREHPDAVRALGSQPQYSQYRAQLTADAEVTMQRGMDAQRERAWAAARIQIREGMTDFRMGDQTQQSRDGRSDRNRAPQSDADRALHGQRDGEMYLTSQAWREYGARRFELAATLLDEDNDHRFTQVMMGNAPITARIFDYTASPIREWGDGRNAGPTIDAGTMVGTDQGWVRGNRLHLTVWNDTSPDGVRSSSMTSFGDRTARQIDPVEEMRRLNWVEMREYASFADRDMFGGSRERVRPVFERMADAQTDLQLAQLGFRRERSGDHNTEYTLVQWQGSPEDMRRVGEAYGEFQQMRGDMQQHLFSFTSPWGDDAHLGYVTRLAVRMEHLQNATVLVQGGPRAERLIARGVELNTPRSYDSELLEAMPYAIHVVEGNSLVRRTGNAPVRDADPTTLSYRGDMVSAQGWYNVTVAAGEFVVATAGVVLAPVTGGASLVLTVGVGALGVHRGFVAREQAGEWTGEAMFQVGMGVLTIVLAPAGYIAGGGRFLVSGAQLGLEAEMAAQGLTSATRAVTTIGRFGRMVQVVEGTAGLSTEAAIAQTTARQLATRFLLGAPELGWGARAVHLTGTAMTLAGVGQFAMQAPRMWQAYLDGELAGHEMAFTLFQTFMQPALQARAAQVMAARSVAGGGIPEYTPRWRQFAEGFWTGTPMMDSQTHALALANHQVMQARSELSAPALASYEAHVQSTGVRLRPQDEATIITQFNQAEANGTVRTFDQFLAAHPEHRIAYLEAARDANFWTTHSTVQVEMVDGQPRIRRIAMTERLQDGTERPTFEYSGPVLRDADLSGEQHIYARARRSGMNETDALAAVDRYNAEVRGSPAVRSAEDLYTQVRTGQRRAEDLSPQIQAYIAAREEGQGPRRSFIEYQTAAGPTARARTADMRARADRASAEVRMRQQRTGLSSELNGQYSGMQGDSYVLGTGDHAVTVSPEHHQVAGDLIFNAEAVLRRAPGESLQQALDNARTRMREQLVQGGMEGTQADRVVDERMARVRQMISNPEFRNATLGAGADRTTQLRIALRESGYLPEIGNRPEVMLAVNRIEAQNIMRSEDLTPADLDHFAIQRSGWADERRTQAEHADSDARVAEISGTPASADIHRERAARLRAEADALDNSAGLLRGEAEARRVVSRAQEMRTQAGQLDAQAGWQTTAPDVATQLRAQAQELRTQADRMAPPPRAPPVQVAPRGETSQLQVTMELTTQVRTDAQTYHDTAQAGLELTSGQAARSTFITGERQYTPQQVTEASRSASVADLIIRRRAAGYEIHDDQIPQMLRDMGLPETLASSVTSLAGNPEFVLSVGLGDRTRGLQVALGQSDAQALSPTAVRARIQQADSQIEQNPAELLRAADERRQGAGLWAERARLETERAHQLERSNADPQAITDAYQRAGAAERIAEEHAQSARRMTDRATALQVPVPPIMVRPPEERGEAGPAPTPRVQAEVPQEGLGEAVIPTVRQVQPQAGPRPRARVADDVAHVQLPQDALAQAILARESNQGQTEWLVGGERITVGGVEQQVSTGTILRTVEDAVVTMARGGEESDVIVVTADKRRLNQINQMLGMGNGDAALSAYREILGRAATRAGGDGAVFLVRPSANGDEVIVVMRVPRGRGQATREAFETRMREATTEVFNERSSPTYTGEHPIGHLSQALRDPRDLVGASISISEPILVRRAQDGSVTARRSDGTDAMITRPDGRREFLPPAIRAADDPRFATEIRGRLGADVRPVDTQLTRGLEPVESDRISQIWNRRTGPLSASDQQVVDQVNAIIRERGLDPANPGHVQRAIDQVAAERSTLAPDATIGTASVGFEVRLMVPEDVRVQLEGLLAETGKGLAEVLENRFGIRGLNTFLGHYGANRVVNEVEAAVGAYAREHGLTIRRAGTMKYIIEGGTEAQTRELFDFINASLSAHGVALTVSRGSPVAAFEPGTTAADALSHISNGHLVVDRRADPARRTDWNGETQHYADANALISAMGIGNDAALRTLLGSNYGDIRQVIELVRSRSDIRNFEDLVTALRVIVGGERGRTLEGAFRRFIVEDGPGFRQRIEAIAPRPQVQAEELPLAAGGEGMIVQPTQRRGPSYRPGQDETVIPTDRVGRTPHPQVSEPAVEISASDLIVVEPALPPPPPPPTPVEMRTTPPMQAPTTQLDLSAGGLPQLVERMMNPATRFDALAQVSRLPPTVRDQVLAYRDRVMALTGDPATQGGARAVLAREYSARIMAAELSTNPDALANYAVGFRFGVDAASVTQQQRDVLSAMPPEVRQVVLEFAATMSPHARGGFRNRGQVAPEFAERLTGALEVASVRDLYNARAAGRVPSDPADSIAVAMLTAGGRSPDFSTPQGHEALVQAAQARRLARDYITRAGRPDALTALSTQAEGIRTGPRPAGRDDAASYDFVQSMAQQSARQSGRSAPEPVDYMQGVLMLSAFQAGNRRTVSVTAVQNFSGEVNGALEQHLLVHLEVGGVEVQARVFRDGRVNIDDASPSAVGLHSWPNEQTRRAFLRYLQDRVREPLRTMLGDAARQIPRTVGLDLADWRAAMNAAQGRTVDLSAGPGTAAPRQASMSPDDVVRVFRTYDVAARRDAVEAFMNMSAADQQAALAGMDSHSRGPMQAAAELESQARQLEAQVMPQVEPLQQRRATLDQEANQLWARRDALRVQADQLEANGDATGAASLRAQSQAIENNEYHPRISQRDAIDQQVATLLQPANDLRQNATNLRHQAQYWNEQALFLREAQGLGPSGSVGRSLSQAYGVPLEVIQRAYLNAGTAPQGRQAVYDALGIRLGALPEVGARSEAYRGFTTLADDPYLGGMIFTGGLVQHVQEVLAPEIQLNPGDRIVLRRVDFQNGLVGAYRLRVEVVDAQGTPRTFTDATGHQRSSITMFVKRQGLTPDSVGAEGGMITGAPSPTVITRGADGRPLTYVNPEGQTIEYGLMRDIHDFRGEIGAGGRRVQVAVDSADSLWDIMYAGGNPGTTQQRAELMGALRDHPDQFMEALGYAQTGFAAGGFYDRHEGNVWAMWLRITNQPPAEAARVAQSLRSQGYLVRDNGDGTSSFLRFGAIDNDTFGSYRAFRRDDGTVSMSGMVSQFTTDLQRVFVHLTQEFNTAEVQRAQIEHRAPRLMTVEQFMEYSFGQNMDGPFMRGMHRWLEENGPNTPQGVAMRQAMTALMQGYDGQRSGMGYAMEGAALARYERQGYEAYGSPLNGRQRTIVDGSDGRTTFVASGQAAGNPTFSTPASRRIAAVIPDGQTRYMIRIDNMPSAARRELTTGLTTSTGQAPRTMSTAVVGGREYIVVEDRATIPAQYRESAIVAARQGDSVYYYNNGPLAVAIPDGRQVYVVPASGLATRDQAAVARGGRRVEVGIEAGPEGTFFVFDRPEDIPAGVRARAVPVTRHGTELSSSSPQMASALGLVSAPSVGAIPMFEHMMGMGEPRWTNLWQRVRDSILQAEGRDRAQAVADPNVGANFLARRVPNPQDRPGLPPEYGGDVQQGPVQPPRAPQVPPTQQGAPPQPILQRPQPLPIMEVRPSQVIREVADMGYGFDAVLTLRSIGGDGSERLVLGGRNGVPERVLTRTQMDQAAEIATYAQLLQQGRIRADQVPEDLRGLAQGLATPQFQAADHAGKLNMTLAAMDQIRPPSPTLRSSPGIEVSDSMVITPRISEPSIEISGSDLIPSDLAPTPRMPPQRAAPNPIVAQHELEGELRVRLESGSEPRYTHPSEPSVVYNAEQMRLARDAGAAAEQMILNGRVPEDTSPQALALARTLAGSSDSPTAFRRATEAGNRSEQILEALRGTREGGRGGGGRGGPPSPPQQGSDEPTRRRPQGAIPVDVAVPAGRVSIDAHFRPGEFTGLHPTPTDVPVYHNLEHTQQVAQMTYDLAIARGLPREQAVYLAQVAMLHDIDPTRTPGRPARVAATIEWMRSGEGQALMSRWGWNERQMAVAEAMIQRTEFPFDGTIVGQAGAFGPRRAPPVYDADARLGAGATDRISGYYTDQSPRSRYIEMLRALSPEDRAFVLREAAMLSEYSDKSSWYFEAPRVVLQAVRGLGTEAGFDPVPTTRGFLDAIGRAPTEGRPGSFDIDLAIARELGMPEPQVRYMQDVLGRLTPQQRGNWEMTREVFGLAEAYYAGERMTPPRAAELGIGSAERTFLDGLRARVGSGEITAQQVPEEIIRFVESRRAQAVEQGRPPPPPLEQQQPPPQERVVPGQVREGPQMVREGPPVVAMAEERGGRRGGPPQQQPQQGGARGEGRREGARGARRGATAPAQEERPVLDVIGMEPGALPPGVRYGREISQEGRSFVEFTYDTGFGTGEQRTRTIRIQAPEAAEGQTLSASDLSAHYRRELFREITEIRNERRSSIVREEEAAGGLQRRLEQLNDDIEHGRTTLDDAISRYPEYSDALRAIRGIDAAQRPQEIARYTERIETERIAPDATLEARGLHLMARDQLRPPEERLGFRGRPNEVAVASMMSRDPTYRAAVSRGDSVEAMRIAREYEGLLNDVEAVRTTTTRGQHVDVVQDARQVTAIGDIHGDVYGMLDQLIRAGVVRDTRPELGRYDSSVPLSERYQINELPEGTQIVFMGDLIDRGSTSPQVIEFVQRLQSEVGSRGSAVHVIRGNHEALFLRFVDLFRNMSTADVERAMSDPAATFDFSQSLGSATLTVPDQAGGTRTITYAQYLSEFGVDVRNASVQDVGIALRNAGIAPTVRSLIQRYGSWENAVREMSVPDGALDFMRSTRGAVMIDGNMFTHAGPVMSARSVADLDAHFEGLFGDVHHHWAWNAQLSGSPGARLRELAGRDDHSVDYVTRDRWHERLDTPEGQQWMQDMGIQHIYVGHDATDSITAISPRVTNLDARLSEAYGALGGILIIDPLQREGHVQVVTGRDEVPSAARARGGPAIDARETDVQDFTNGRERTEVLPGNRISEASQRFYEPQAAIGMRRGEMPEGVEFIGVGTDIISGSRPGIRQAEFHMQMPGGETEIIVINVPPESSTPAQRRRYYQIELAREMRRVGNARTASLQTRERLLLSGDVSPELGLRLPPGPEQAGMRGVAILLEQMARSPESFPEARIRADYPEYFDAVMRIRTRAGEERVQEILDSANNILAERQLSSARMDGIVRLVEGGADLGRATRAMDRVVEEARRFGRTFEPDNPTDRMLMRLVNDDASARPGVPREVVALELLQSLSAEAGAISNSTESSRALNPSIALGYETAMARARSQGRTAPSEEDFIFGAMARRSAGPVADMMLAYIHDINARYPDRAPELIIELTHTASAILGRIPLASPTSFQESAVVGSALDLALSLHLAGVRDVPSIFSNSRGNGILDLFPIAGEADFARARTAMSLVQNLADSTPQSITVRREQRGRTSEITVPREQAIETLINYALDDARRLPADARIRYMSSVSDGFAWNERLTERIGGMLVDERGNPTPASITDSRLPLSAYTFDDPTGVLVATLDNSLIRSEMRPNRIFRTMVDLVESLGRARDHGTEADIAWIALVRQKFEYMQGLEGRGLSRKDREAAIKSFMREMLPHIQGLYDNYLRQEVQPTQLTQIAGQLREQDTREGFINTLGSAYREMLPPEMGVTSEFAAGNTELVLDLGAYRRDLQRYSSTGSIPGARDEQFAGSPTYQRQRQPHMRGEAFDEAIPVLDQAVRARAQGPEAFRDFKFSREFHDEMVQSHPSQLPDGRVQGEAIFGTWRQDYRSQETIAGTRYDISESGSFEDSFYGGRVRGEITCQDTRFGKMHVTGVVGTVELPWVKQMIVRNPDTGEIVYRRRMFLVHGDDGRSILLLQPEYGARGLPGRAELRQRITAEVRARYEALGIEVREMPNRALSADTPTTQYPEGINTGYGTYASGRSPFFYIDSNAWWIGIGSPETGGATLGQNGLHTRRPGDTVHFGRGWSGRIDLTLEGTGQ